MAEQLLDNSNEKYTFNEKQFIYFLLNINGKNKTKKYEKQNLLCIFERIIPVS